jgi:uncharacterized protein (DUF1800 family)
VAKKPVIKAVSTPDAYRILSRLSYGPTPAAVAELQKLGLSAWVAAQLNPKRTEFPELQATLDTFRSSKMSIAEVYADPHYTASRLHVADDIVFAALLRQSFGNNQLQETLAEHFNDYLHTSVFFSGDRFRASYDRDVIRANLLGSYPDMVVAATLHPAMMDYLNLDRSTAAHPNENYARELLELFTVSTGAGYSEDDVQNAAQLMTGFSWNTNNSTLRVNLRDHYFGPLTVMGYTDANPATKNTADVVASAQNLARNLALRPATATAFATRLIRRFVADVPNAKYVSDLAKVYLASKGNIPKVVTAMILHPAFLATASTKVKRPVEHLASTIRALNVKLAKPVNGGDASLSYYYKGSGAIVLTQIADNQGHLPFKWAFPNGYPDYAEAWTTFSSQIQRWNLAADLVLGRQAANFTPVDWTALVPATAQTVPEIIQALAVSFMGGNLPKGQLASVQTTVNTAVVPVLNPTLRRQRAIETAAVLLLSTPEWNQR